jgi:prepilin-type N-terminal cleavage/methylation domain-containing protein
MRLFMIDRQMKNEKGFTLIELMIAAAMGVVLLGAAVYTYSKQDKLLRNENRKLQLRDYARMTMDELEPMLRMAGNGLPPGNSVAARDALGVVAADATSITFLANTDGVSTSLSLDCGQLQPFVPVENITGFANGDSVSIFDTRDPTNAEQRVLNGAGVGTVTTSLCPDLSGDVTSGGLFFPSGSPLTILYRPFLNGAAVVVYRYNTITYTYNAGAQTITVTDDQGNGTNITTTVANNISDLTFSYFDATGGALSLPLNSTELASIRRMNVSLTVVDEIETDETVLLITDINMRNMGT